MIKSKVIGLDENAMRAAMMKTVVEEQNRRLIDYAAGENGLVYQIGDRIKQYHSRHNMDRTGNLLDSLLWGVSYQGKLVKGGFYRETPAAFEDSGLHEWSKVSFRDKETGGWIEDVSAETPVNGRQLADAYLTKYGNNGARGWRVFFAILAPYWGYWEKGFRMTHGIIPKNSVGNPSKAYAKGIRSFYQFAVMTEYHDVAKNDLKPMRVRIRTHVEKYTSLKLYKRAKKDFYGR